MTRNRFRIGAAFNTACLLAGAACIADWPQSSAAQNRPDRNWIKDLRKPSPVSGTVATKSGPGVAPPGAGGRTFATLDAYLAYLKTHAAPMDRPWYQEVRPGLFRLETGNLKPLDGAPPPRLFTREELERRFGFRK